jgi:hypothetical protein
MLRYIGLLLISSLKAGSATAFERCRKDLRVWSSECVTSLRPVAGHLLTFILTACNLRGWVRHHCPVVVNAKAILVRSGFVAAAAGGVVLL